MLTHFVFLLRQWFRERASVLQCLCGFLLVRYGTAYRHVYWRWCARWMIHIQNSGKTELVRFLYSNSVIIICDRNIKNLFFFFFSWSVLGELKAWTRLWNRRKRRSLWRIFRYNRGHFVLQEWVQAPVLSSFFQARSQNCEKWLWVSSCPPVLPSGCMEQLGFHSTGFDEIWY